MRLNQIIINVLKGFKDKKEKKCTFVNHLVKP